MRSKWCVPVAAFALVGGSLLASSGASAATHSAPNSAHSAVQPGGLAKLTSGAHGDRSNASATSENWSGYAVHSGTYKSVSASWTEPTGKCSGNSGDKYSSFWVGLDGYSSSTVEQTGTEVDCDGSSPQYYAWYEFYPAGSVELNEHVSPGDHFTGSVTFSGTSTFTLKLTDSTQGWSKTETKSSSSDKRSSAEVIIEAPCCTETGGILPLADFGTAHFTASKVDGSNIGSLSPTEITMVSSGGVTEDKISALTSGTAFTGTWLAS
jgi:Peptidase A4 family